MGEFLARLNFGVVELILTGLGGLTIKGVVGELKKKFAFISGIWTNVATALVGSGFVAAYLAVFDTFTIDMWTGYSVLVFIASIVDHNIIKTVLEYLKNLKANK